MTLGLHSLRPAKGSAKTKFVVGRGHGSGLGKTSGRGMKGQKARSGVSGLRLKGFRAQMLATPKLRGFQSHAPRLTTIPLERLFESFEKSAAVTPEALRAKGLIARTDRGGKIVATGRARFPLHLQAVACTAGAKKAIEEAGGSVK